MLKQIKIHPSLCYAQDIATICEPLKHLNINYFAHVNIDKEGKFSAIGKNPEFAQHYLTNQYYNFDIHMANASQLGEYIVWDIVERCGQSAKLYKESVEHGVNHTFTIIEKGVNGNDYYHFASSVPESSMNQIYIANLDLLQLFILHFKEKMRQSKLLSQAYELKFYLDKDEEGHVIKASHNKNQRASFLQSINLNMGIASTIEKPLSARELEVMAWLHYGKRACDIAQIIDVAEITVNKHISNIKEKTQCYTLFQLGEFFSKMFPQKEVIDYFLRTKAIK